MSALEAAAEALGVQLMPWQKTLGERILNGERVYFITGRRVGMNTLKRTVAEAQRIMEEGK